jgi:hypothetical protein
MGYREMVIAQVDKAFSLLKNLAVDVVLIEKTATAFAFNSGTATVSTPTNKTVRGVVLNKGNAAAVSTTLRLELLLKAKDIDQPDIYDKFTIAGVTWNIVPPFKNDGYTITIIGARES